VASVVGARTKALLEDCFGTGLPLGSTISPRVTTPDEPEPPHPGTITTLVPL
jgi:hypothetical protein